MESLDKYTEDNKEDNYKIRYGSKIQRVAKIFSYTFWRTECENEVFWSVQGNNSNGSIFIITSYFGPEEEAKRFQQEIILHHPEEKEIKMIYYASCVGGMNCVNISKTIVEHFKSGSNFVRFEYRIVKLKRRPFPQRIFV